MKLGNYFILCTDQKNLQKMFIKFWLTLYKNGSNLLNSENSKTSEPHRFKLDLTGKLNLKNPNKNIALANLSIYYTCKNIKSEYNNNKFKISTPTWNETFDLSVASYSIDGIQDYLEFFIKKHKTWTGNPPVDIYPNKTNNRIDFNIKAGYKLELLTSETMRLLGSTKKDVDADTNSENLPKLESAEVVLVHCNLAKMIISTHQKFYLVLFWTNNLDN